MRRDVSSGVDIDLELLWHIWLTAGVRDPAVLVAHGALLGLVLLLYALWVTQTKEETVNFRTEFPKVFHVQVIS